MPAHPTRRALLTLSALGGAGLLAERAGWSKAVGPGMHAIDGEDAVAVAGALSLLSHAEFGSGRILYSFMSSLCHVCKGFFRDHPDFALPGLALRHIPYPLSDRESGAVSRVVEKPGPATFRQFMEGRFLSAPPVAETEDYSIEASPRNAVERYSRHMQLLSHVETLFRQNGSADLPGGTPRFLFTTRTGQAWMIVGTPTEKLFAMIARTP